MVFRHFIGVAPRIYRKVFNYEHDNPVFASKRKDKEGQAIDCKPNLEKWYFDEKGYEEILSQVTRDMSGILNKKFKDTAAKKIKKLIQDI